MKKEMESLKEWFEKEYGVSSETEIAYEGQTYTGYMYGNDECFDCNEFYQYFLTEDKLYKAYFQIPDDDADFGNIDYEHPYKLIDADAQYYIDYVI